MARDVSHIEVQNYGMACQPSQSRQPPCIVSRKLFKKCSFHFDFRFELLTSLQIGFDHCKLGFIV